MKGRTSIFDRLRSHTCSRRPLPACGWRLWTAPRSVTARGDWSPEWLVSAV